MPKKHNRYQFSLRILLSLTALVAVVCKLVLLFGWIVLPVAVLAGCLTIARVIAKRSPESPGFDGVLCVGVGAFAGFVCVEIIGAEYNSGPKGALVGAIVSEIVWIILRIHPARGVDRTSVIWKSHFVCEPRKSFHAILFAVGIFLLGPLVSLALCVTFIHGWGVPVIDYAFYLTRFLSIGICGGMLIGMPYLLAAIGIVRCRSH